MINIEKILERIKAGDISIKRQNYPSETFKIEPLLEAYRAIGDAMYPGYVIDKNNEYCIRNLILWLFAQPSMESLYVAENGKLAKKPGDVKKGLYIYGPTGTGKSLCMHVLGRMAFYFDIKVRRGTLEPETLSWTPFRTDDIVEAYSHGTTLTEFKTLPYACFNDLGTEPTDAIYMGQRLNVMRSIIEARGDRQNSTLTFITSNIPLDSPDLVKLYGDRAVSRLKGMCNFLVLGGGDRRK